MAVAGRSLCVAAIVLAACGTPPYAPCPVALPGGLPPDAFAVCRDLLRREYGAVAVADAAAFLLQTTWAPVDDPPGERRASIFRDEDGHGLAVVVELRRLTEPLFGMPRWTEPRGWDAAERQLAARLQEVLGTPVVTR